MKDQKTDTVNTLNTAIQTKKARATKTVCQSDFSSSQNRIRFATKKRYTTGMNFGRGSFATTAASSGAVASNAMKVAVNSHGRLRVPPVTPISSRSGRRM